MFKSCHPDTVTPTRPNFDRPEICSLHKLDIRGSSLEARDGRGRSGWRMTVLLMIVELTTDL